MTRYIPNMEYMVTEVCNLACQHCNNYSDYKTSVTNTWATAKKEIELWLTRGIEFGSFSLIGGEPLINPDLPTYITGLRELMPNTLIQVVTNGTIIKNVPNMLDALYSAGNFRLHYTSYYPDEDNDREFINLVKKMPLEWTQNDNKEDWLSTEWLSHKDQRYISFRVSKPTTFLASYKGPLSAMKPYASDPSIAFDACIQKICPLMYKGELHKCSISALLKRTLTDFNLTGDLVWQDYLNIKGLSPDCSESELDAYIENFGKPKDFCSMCPEPNDNAWVSHVLKWKAEI